MVDLETSVERAEDVTFVRAIVTNDRGTHQYIRLQSQLDGPIWPPRHDGVPAPSFYGEYWERVIAPGGTHGFGFASPAEPVDPPLEIVEVERASADADRTEERVLATLDPALPPRTILSR